jgi:hypothetical protein
MTRAHAASADEHRLVPPHFGAVGGWLPKSNRVAGAVPDQRETLIQLGVSYGRQTLAPLGLLERWHLGSELKRALRHSVRPEWTEADVRRLVDLVLKNAD